MSPRDAHTFLSFGHILCILKQTSLREKLTALRKERGRETYNRWMGSDYVISKNGGKQHRFLYPHKLYQSMGFGGQCILQALAIFTYQERSEHHAVPVGVVVICLRYSRVLGGSATRTYIQTAHTQKQGRTYSLLSLLTQMCA